MIYFSAPTESPRFMTRFFRLPLLAALVVMPFLAACTDPEAALVEKARGIHERVITLDTHVDISPANFTEERNYTEDLPVQVNLPKMKEGGLDVAWFVVFVGQGPLNDSGYTAATASAIEKFNAIHWLAEQKAPDQIEIAYTSDDVRRIAASGKKVAMIAIENGYQVGTDLSNIQRFQEQGGRYMSFSHNGHSQLADSNTGERDSTWLHGGLSELGRQAVAEMNRVGMMIDISHPAKTSNLQMMELSAAPVMASHSSARALNNVSRNLDDEELLALKENGGVVQTVAFAGYVNEAKAERNRAAADSIRSVIATEMGIQPVDRRTMFTMTPEQRDSVRAAMQPLNDAVAARQTEIDSIAPPVDVADFVNHIDYLVKLIGIDHVGISSDFDGGGGVKGWADASETFNVTLELVRRGYTEEEIAKMWSGNLLRVLDEVQRVAAELQNRG